MTDPNRYIRCGRRGDTFALLIVNNGNWLLECETLYPLDDLPTIKKQLEKLTTPHCSTCKCPEGTAIWYCSDGHRHELTASEVRYFLNGVRWVHSTNPLPPAILEYTEAKHFDPSDHDSSKRVSFRELIARRLRRED